MAKPYSLTKPRLTIYLTPEEMKATKNAAAHAGLTTPHQFAGMVLRRALQGAAFSPAPPAPRKSSAIAGS